MKAADFDCTYQSTFIPSACPFITHRSAVILLGSKYEIIRAVQLKFSRRLMFPALSTQYKCIQNKHSLLFPDTCSVFSLLRTAQRHLLSLHTPFFPFWHPFMNLTLKGKVGQIRRCTEHLCSAWQADVRNCSERNACRERSLTSSGQCAHMLVLDSKKL